MDTESRNDNTISGTLRRQVASLMRRLNYKDTKLKDAEDDITAIRQRYRRRLHVARELHERQNSDLQRQVDALQRELQTTQTLLQTRTAELQDAQTYLTLTDSHSHSDILRLVEEINNSIFQSSAAIADSIIDLAQWKDKELRAQGADKGLRDRVIKDLGEGLVRLLENGDHTRDPICIQIAMQAYMVIFAKWLILTWDPTAPDLPENILNTVEYKMRQDGASVRPLITRSCY